LLVARTFVSAFSFVSLVCLFCLKMGCNQSKNEDIRNDNEQRARTQAVNTGSAPNNISGANMAVSPVRPIGTPLQAVLDADAQNLGMSYTDTRDLESDYFKDIIERTTQNFIDVAITTGPLEGKDALERARDYSDKVSKTVVGKPSVLFSVPLPSSSTPSNLKPFLSVDTVDKELINKFSHNCSAAFQSMHIESRGDLIVSFSEITA